MKLLTMEDLLTLGVDLERRAVSQYIDEPGLEVYMRVGPYHFDGEERHLAVGIARVSVTDPKAMRKGLFKQFLYRLTEQAKEKGYKVVRVEQVSNPELLKYLTRKGYEELNPDQGLPVVFKYVD